MQKEKRRCPIPWEKPHLGKQAFYPKDEKLGAQRECYLFLLRTVEFLVAEQWYLNGYGDLEVLQLSIGMTDIYTFAPIHFSLSGGTGEQSDN